MITFRAGITHSRVIITLNSYFFVLNFTVLCTLSTAAHGLDKAFISDVGTHQVKALWKVLNATVICLEGNGRLLWRTILIINAILITHQFLAIPVNIGSCEVSHIALLIIKTESTVQLEIVIRIAIPAIAVAVPQQTVVLIRQHKGDAHFGIILEEVLVLALHIELFALVLA